MSDQQTRSGGEVVPWPTRSDRSDPESDVGAPAADGADQSGDGSGGDWGYSAYMSRWGDSGVTPTTRSSWFRLALLVGAIVGLGVVFGVTLIAVILALLVSIVLHELGHYLAAKRSGMKVTEFFVGFGPRIWSFRRGETEYGVKAIPAGAYVRIIGMSNLDRVPPEDEDRTYRAQSYPKRLITILAGPLMNIALGFVLLVVLFSTFGATDPAQWSVRSVSPDSSAAAAGVRPGDRILAVEGTPVSSFEELGPLMSDLAGRAVTLTVWRDGQTVELPVNLGWRLNATGAAQVPGASPRDRITSIDGHPVGTYEEAAAALRAAQGPVTLELEHRSFLWRTTVHGPIDLPPGGKAGYLGILPNAALGSNRLNPLEATGEAARTLGTMTVATFSGLGRLFSPAGLNNYTSQVLDAAGGTTDDPQPVQVGDTVLEPVGPAPGSSLRTPTEASDADRPVSIVGIVQLGNSAAGIGWDKLAFLLAAVNFALGFFNLIPLLPLDGGHAAVATYEAVRSRRGRPYRVDMAKLMPVTYLAVALLLMFGLSAIFLDIRNPLTLTP